MKQIQSAREGYLPVDKEPNANDANVLVALEKYYALLEKLNYSIEELTQEQAKTGALGQYIQDNVGEKNVLGSNCIRSGCSKFIKMQI